MWGSLDREWPINSFFRVESASAMHRTAHCHIGDMANLSSMKKIGFLSFGHWGPSPQSRTQSGADALLQSIELGVEAERLGMDGAFFRVHHFAQQLASPFPLLAAVGAKTRKIEIGTAVIDMRYENPHYMAEDAGAADLISGGRLQLGISRGSPEQVIDGWRYFGYRPIKGEDDEGMGRRHAEEFDCPMLTRVRAVKHASRTLALRWRRSASRFPKPLTFSSGT
jgi:Luciferase-like monooxygenase